MEREQKYKIWTGSIMMQPKSLLVFHQETVSGLTVGQWEKQIYLEYTNHKDKKGIEIYEEDIIKVFDDFGNESICVVEYKDGSLIIEYDFGDYDMTTVGWAIDWWNNAACNYEVIGNRLENPELLLNKG